MNRGCHVYGCFIAEFPREGVSSRGTRSFLVTQAMVALSIRRPLQVLHFKVHSYVTDTRDVIKLTTVMIKLPQVLRLDTYGSKTGIVPSW